MQEVCCGRKFYRSNLAGGFWAGDKFFAKTSIAVKAGALAPPTVIPAKATGSRLKPGLSQPYFFRN